MPRNSLRLLAIAAPFCLPLATLVGCNSGFYTSSDLAWDPAVLAAKDGVYVRLPAAGKLARVTSDGAYAEVDLNGASPDSMTLVPGGDEVIVHASWPICDTARKVKWVSDCADKDLSYGHELDIVSNGAVIGTSTDVPYQFNAMGFNADASLAVAYLDFANAGSIDVTGVLNLTEAVFMDLGTSEVHRVPVGFAPENVLFTADNQKAVVLSRSQVAVVDLATWTVSVNFPLTLSANDVVEPTSVVLTPDGKDALVTIAGSPNLYVLDLVAESIDIVELNAVPAALQVDAANDRTVIVYANTPEVDVLEHTYFSTKAYTLTEPASAISEAGTSQLLYNPGSSYHDVYAFDVASGTLNEFRAENPVEAMYVSDDGTVAMATTTPEGGGSSGDVSSFYDSYYGLSIFDLASNHTPAALALQAAPVGVQLVSEGGVNTAFVLLDGVEELQQVDLATGSATTLKLPAPPVGITAMPGGPFVVSHASALGLLSFYDVASNTFVSAANFGTLGLYDQAVLPRLEVSK